MDDYTPYLDPLIAQLFRTDNDVNGNGRGYVRVSEIEDSDTDYLTTVAVIGQAHDEVQAHLETRVVFPGRRIIWARSVRIAPSRYRDDVREARQRGWYR